MSLSKALLAGGCVVGGFIYFFFPKIITGDFAEVTIDKVTIQPTGQVVADFSIVAASGTQVVQAIYDGDQYGGGGNGGGGKGPFGRPSRGFSDLYFNLNPEKKPPENSLAKSSWSGRLLAHEGERRRLHLGERFYLFDFQTADGIRHCGYLEADSS